MSESMQAQGEAAKHARKHACDECRTRKIKCDAVRPACLSCLSRGLGETCTYKAKAIARTEGHQKKRARLEGGERILFTTAGDYTPPSLPRRPIRVNAFDAFGHAHVMRRTTRGAGERWWQRAVTRQV